MHYCPVPPEQGEQQLDLEALLRRHLKPIHPTVRAILLAAIDGHPRSKAALRKVLRARL